MANSVQGKHVKTPLLDVVDGSSQLVFVSLNLDMSRESRPSPALQIVTNIIKNWSHVL